LTQQRFKAGEGGHDVDLFDGVEEVAHGDVFNQGIACGAGFGLEGTALAEACGDRFAFGVVLYDGADRVPFGDRLAAAPLSCLWA
jgi:hypothetical protein